MSPVTDSKRRPARRDRQVLDLSCWLLLVAVGLAAVALAGTPAGGHAPPPFGRYRLAPSPWLLAAAALAAAVLAGQALLDRYRRRPSFGAVQAVGYLAALGWAVLLGLARHAPPPADPVDGSPLAYLRHFTDRYADAAHGRPPGPGLLRWAIDTAGLPAVPVLAALGALAVPLLLGAARNICGDQEARRFAPVLVLAPYAVLSAFGTDGVAAALGAGLVAAGARASARHRTGWPATGWAFGAGLVFGVVALFSYPAVWLGGSVVLLYFARRRPFLNIATGIGALVVPLLTAAAGYGWTTGLLAARTGGVGDGLWWGALSLATLLVVGGPPLVASLRKMRNTPAWPCLVGAGLAVAVAVLAGFGHADTAVTWLPLYGWLTVAATAPAVPAGPPVPAPLLLTAAGAAAALVLACLPAA